MITGKIGEFEVDLVVETEQSARQDSGIKVAAMSDDEMLAGIERFTQVHGELLANLARQMVDVLAAQNKGGRTSLRRAWREVYVVLDQAISSGNYTREELEDGMSVAVEKGKPNVGYAKAVARGRRVDGSPDGGGPAAPVARYRTVQS